MLLEAKGVKEKERDCEVLLEALSTVHPICLSRSVPEGLREGEPDGTRDEQLTLSA